MDLANQGSCIGEISIGEISAVETLIRIHRGFLAISFHYVTLSNKGSGDRSPANQV